MMLVMPQTTVVAIIILAHYCIWRHAEAEDHAISAELILTLKNL